MPLQPPDPAAIHRLGKHYGLGLSDADVESFSPFVHGLRHVAGRRRADGFGRHGDDATVLRVAHNFEQAVGGFPTPQPVTAGSRS